MQLYIGTYFGSVLGEAEGSRSVFDNVKMYLKTQWIPMQFNRLKQVSCCCCYLCDSVDSSFKSRYDVTEFQNLCVNNKILFIFFNRYDIICCVILLFIQHQFTCNKFLRFNLPADLSNRSVFLSCINHSKAISVEAGPNPTSVGVKRRCKTSDACYISNHGDRCVLTRHQSNGILESERRTAAAADGCCGWWWRRRRRWVCD